MEDAGFRDAIGSEMAAMDGVGPDGALDAPPTMDTPAGDTATLDAFDAFDAPNPPDSGADGAVGDAPVTPTDAVDVAIDHGFPGFDAQDVFTPGYCDTDGGASCVNDNDCGSTGQRCIPSGCGATMRCQAAGRSCVDASDCLAGAQRCAGGFCVATSPADCGDTRACPLGFVCEGAAGARTCVNRRHACDGSGYANCPWGATCTAARGVAPFCVPLITRCAHDSACLLGLHCRDIDGDGLNECVADGCSAGSCDAGANLCELLPLEVTTHCGLHGVCSAGAPCAPGWSCVDDWGTGVGECHPTVDPCRAQSDCPPPALCYPSDPGGDGGAASCVGP